MKEAIAFSRKLSGALVIQITTVDDDVYEVVRDDRGLVVPAIEQGAGHYLIDDAYLSAVQQFIAGVKTRRPPMYARFDEHGAMIPAPKDAPGEPEDEPGGLKP